MDLTTVEPRSCEQVFGFNIRALITILMLYLYYCSYRIVGPRTLFYIIIKAPISGRLGLGFRVQIVGWLPPRAQLQKPLRLGI